MSSNECVIQEAEDKGARLEILIDTDPESPRTWDNLGTMVCFDHDYKLGDKEHRFSRAVADGDPEEEWGETEKRFIKESKEERNVAEYCKYCLQGWALKNECTEIVRRIVGECRGKFVSKELAAIIPLYLHVYSNTNISMSLSGGHQVGFILVTKDKVRNEFRKKKISKKLMKQVVDILKSEVEVYNQWIEGDVYGFRLEKTDGTHIDSCWGFYGSDPRTNGMIDNIPKEYEHLIDKLHSKY